MLTNACCNLNLHYVRLIAQEILLSGELNDQYNHISYYGSIQIN